MYSTTFNKEQNLWYGPDILPLYNPKISIAQGLLDSMKVHSVRTAQVSDNDGTRMTYGEMRMKTIRAAQNLQALKVQPKQVITIVTKNSLNVVPIAFASLAIGCTVNPIDEILQKNQFLNVLKSTKPSIIFCDVEFYDTLNECAKELENAVEFFTFGSTIGQSKLAESLFEETHEENRFIPVRVDAENDIAFILCTSGTTGTPKFISWSHVHILYTMSKFEVDSNEVVLTMFTNCFAHEIMMLMKATLVGASRVITTEDFSPELILGMIERHKVTTAQFIIHHIVTIMDSERFDETDISSLKVFFVGGGKFPSHVKARIISSFKNVNIRLTYGMTESGWVSTDEPMKLEDGTAGQLATGICVKIVDEHGNRCGIDVDGEVCVKTDFKCLGYHENPQANLELFDEENFVRTGDIGHFNENGDLLITCRKKEFLRYCDFEMNPLEIEDYLTKSPDIQAACVIGMPCELGDLLTAVVVRANGSNISEREVIDLVADNFVEFYRLRGGVHFVDELQRTNNGKLNRRKIVEQFILAKNDYAKKRILFVKRKSSTSICV